jgi:hypothetical protein
MNTQATPLSSDMVARAAYFLWLQAGCPNGRDLEFWLRAEQEITGKRNLVSPHGLSHGLHRPEKRTCGPTRLKLRILSSPISSAQPAP